MVDGHDAKPGGVVSVGNKMEMYAERSPEGDAYSKPHTLPLPTPAMNLSCWGQHYIGGRHEESGNSLKTCQKWQFSTQAGQR